MTGRIAKLYGLILSLMVCSPMTAEVKGGEYLKYVHEIVGVCSKEMRDHFGLVCVGSGGSMPHDVEKMRIVFESIRKVSIEEARSLEIKVIERLREVINAHQYIRPFLREYPFPHERIEVQIAFINKRGESYIDGSVALTFQTQNRLFYFSRDRETDDLVDLYDEPYEEAYRKVYKIQ